MKKNNIFNIKSTSVILLSLSSLGFSACDKDLLETVPKTEVLTSSMWLTDNLTDLGVNGVYSVLRSGQTLYKYDSYDVLQGRDNSILMNGTATASSSLFSDEWKVLYEGVHSANRAIEGITTISPSEATKKARLIAEVKFLRAFFYFRLNQLFKGVPIYTESAAWNAYSKPRSTEAEVWALTIQDLTDCINEVNLPDRYTSGNANYGRISKSAAYALRGKVYMYLKQYDKAILDFQKVKDLGHTLFASYKDLFVGANEQSPEVIFSIQNKALAGYGSDYQFMLGSRSAFGSNWNTYLVHPDLVDLYQNLDGSKFNWDTYFPGYSTMPAASREVFFLRNNLTAAEITTMTAKGLNMSLYLPTGNEQRVTTAFANRDPRLAANVIVPYSTFLGNNNGVDQTFTSRWPYRAEFNGVFDFRTDITARCYYYPRKFVYTGANPGIPDRSSGAYDYIVMRYADIVLLWAEALNESTSTADAVIKINEVRSRAGVGAVASTISQSNLRNEIRDERRRELVAEGVIYFDELRWGTLKDRVFYTGNGIKEVWGTVTSPYTWGGEQMYVWPIPQVERERNTSLTQNTGWAN